jgi:drug/metabolite transporter (DMT)-like permease
MNMYILLAIPMVLLFSIENVLWKYNRKSSFLTSLQGVTFWSLICVIIAFGLSFIWQGDAGVFLNYSWLAFGMAAVQASFIVCNILLWVAVMRCMPLSIAEPFSMFRVILLLLMQFVIFGVTVGTAQVVLIIVIFAACAGISLLQTIGKKRKIDRNYLKGFLLLLAWVVTSVGINLVNQYVVGPKFLGFLAVPPITHAAIQTGLVCLISTAIFLIKSPKTYLSSFKTILTNKIHIGIGATGVFGRVCFTVILWSGATTVAVLTAIEMALIAPVVIYGVIFLKERPRIWSYILIGVIIVSATVLPLIVPYQIDTKTVFIILGAMLVVSQLAFNGIILQRQHNMKNAMTEYAQRIQVQDNTQTEVKVSK